VNPDALMTDRQRAVSAAMIAAAGVVQEWRCEIISRGCCTELKIWFPTAEGR
jgi:hypothetical protein